MVSKDYIIDFCTKLIQNFLVEVDPYRTDDPFYPKLKSKSVYPKNQCCSTGIRILIIDLLFWPRFAMNADDEVLRNLTAETDKLYTSYAFMDLLAKELRENNKSVCVLIILVENNFCPTQSQTLTRAGPGPPDDPNASATLPGRAHH
uniref:Uncharacterized protein n=1 Tax=Romanomermis culicivorax TaxID=13658 RepID=A0A915KS56_ROMCU